MGGFIRSKAAVAAVAWLFVATTTFLGTPTTIPVVSAKRSTSRNLKTFVKQRKLNEHSAAHDSLTINKLQHVLPNSLPNNLRSLSGDHDMKPKRGLMGGSGKGKGGKGDEEYDDDASLGKGKGGEEYDDDASYGKGKGKGKGKDKKSKKMKGKGKSKGKGKGKGKDGGLPEICSKLDFGVEEDDYSGKGKGKGGGKGKGKGHHELEYDEVLCDPNVFDEAKNIVDISIFVSLIEQAKLEEIFLCAGPFTILAPSNAAFADNPSITKYLADVHNIKELREVLLYHILPGLTLEDEFTKGSIEALQGDVITVSVDPLLFNSIASVKEGDIMACNGAINIIDSILLPPGITIVPEICADLDFSSTYDRRLQSDGALCDPNVIETARLNKELSTFVELIELAGLTEYFMCSGPFTLLAPTNDAFDGLDAATLDELLLPVNQDKLKDLLLYHIVPGLILSDDFEDGSIDTLLVDQSISVTVDPVQFNGRADIVEADIISCNGVIHAINDVLVPVSDFCQMFTFDGETEGANCMPNILEVARQMPEFALTVTLIERAELTDIFSCPGPFTGNLPSNAAWDDVDPAFLELILRPDNVDQLEDLLLYHFLPGLYPTTSLVPGPLDTLLSGETVSVSLNPIAFDGVEVGQTDIQACNGLLNELKSLLIPFGTPTPLPAPAKAPVSAPIPLIPTTDSVVPTIAPSDEIAPAAPSPVIPSTVAPSICDLYDFGGETEGAECSPNILDTAREMSELSLAVILFERAGLTEIFDCAGPFTVQLPTNDAVENVDAALLDFLLRPENQEELMNLMLYHVLPGSFPTADLVPGPTPTLASDAEVVVSLNPTMFNNATVLMADIAACNGLINTIDSVLTFLPTAPTASPSVQPEETDSPTPPIGSPTLSPAIESEQPAVSKVPTIPDGSPTSAPTAAPGTASPGPTTTSDQPSAAPFVVPVGPPVIGDTTAPTVAPGQTTSAPDSGATTAPGTVSDPPSTSPVTAPIGGSAAPTVAPAVGGTAAPGGSAAPTVAPAVGGTLAPGAISDPPSATPIIGGTTAPTGSPVSGGTSAPTGTPVLGGTPAPTGTPVLGGTPAPGTVSDPPSATPFAAPAGGGTGAPVDGGTQAPGVVSDPPSLAPSGMLETDAPVAGGVPTEEPLLRIRVENFFMAYVAPGAVEPTEDQYAQLVDVTNDFFTDTLTAMFATDPAVTFLRTESTLGFSLFNASIPAERFNIYTDYDYTDLIYTTNSTPPDAAASFILLRDSINRDYITAYVRTLTDTPFVTTNEVVFRASTMEAPTNRSDTLQRSGNNEEDANGLTVATVTATGAAALMIFAAAMLVYRKKRSSRRRDEALYDGIYAADGKATLEGYFTERSVTDTSETAAGKSSTRLPVVSEEGQPLQVRV